MGYERLVRPAIGLAVAMAVVLATFAVLATDNALATDSDDELAPPPEPQGTIGGDVGVQGDTIGGTKIYNVDPASFVASGTTSQSFTAGGNCLRTDGNNYAPVDIPHRAEVTAVIAYVRDDSETGTMSISLRRRTFNTPSTENLFSGSTGAEETPGRTTLALENNGFNNTLNKQGDSFFIRVRMTEETPVLELCNVQVLYRAPSTSGLQFQSVAPCAIFDTRPGNGGIERKLDPGEAITVDTIMSDYSSQGGFDGSCGIPSATGTGLFSDPEFQTVAVALNLVALNPEGRGNLRAWKDGDPTPSGGVLIYPGENNNASVTIEVKEGTAFGSNNGGQITIQNNGEDKVHVRAVATGYYTPVDSRW